MAKLCTLLRVIVHPTLSHCALYSESAVSRMVIMLESIEYLKGATASAFHSLGKVADEV
jgi:hypothetical protein